MTDAEHSRARRERLGVDAVRAENREAARRSRAKKRAAREQRERDAAIDAAIIRAFFANSPTDGTRLIAFTASNGKTQSRILEAAYRLAGGRS